MMRADLTALVLSGAVLVLSARSARAESAPEPQQQNPQQKIAKADPERKTKSGKVSFQSTSNAQQSAPQQSAPQQAAPQKQPASSASLGTKSANDAQLLTPVKGLGKTEPSNEKLIALPKQLPMSKDANTADTDAADVSTVNAKKSPRDAKMVDDAKAQNAKLAAEEAKQREEAKKRELARQLEERDAKTNELGAFILGRAIADPARVDAGLITKLLPAGWRLETRDVPEGVAGVAIGPATKTGRATIILSHAGELPEAPAWDTDEARAFLTKTLGPDVVLVEIVAHGLLGGPEIVAERRTRGPEVFTVRHVISTKPAGWMLTVLAPKSQFASVYGRIAAIVAAGAAANADIPPTAEKR